MTVLTWQSAAITDRGKKRSENQDNFYISPDQRVFVVADGLGGELGGGTASKLAVEAIEKFWQKKTPPNANQKDIEAWLEEAIFIANENVFKTSENNLSLNGMGTTIVLAVQAGSNLHIAHVGDSRAYRVKNGNAVPLTQDHSLVMELLSQGKLSAEQVRTSPMKNYITRCLGRTAQTTADHTPVELNSDEWILLCSDGLTSVLADEEIGDITNKLDHPDEVCQELVKQTLNAGAPDNVTIIAVKYSLSKTKQEALIEDTIKK